MVGVWMELGWVAVLRLLFGYYQMTLDSIEGVKR